MCGVSPLALVGAAMHTVACRQSAALSEAAGSLRALHLSVEEKVQDDVSVTTGTEGFVDYLDDTVTVLVPDGPDRLTSVLVGDATALDRYLHSLNNDILDITGVAADCRDGLLPCSFTARYIGTTEPTGDYIHTGVAFEFQPTDGGETVALPFGWLTVIRAHHTH